MRNVLIYIAALSVCSVVVFLSFYTVGRRTSLEQELAKRNSTLQAKDRSLTISSLAPTLPEEPEGEEAPPPEVHTPARDITVTRFPQEEGGMVLLLDREILSPESREAYAPPSRFRSGVESFFGRMPSNISLGMRSLAGGVEGDCAGTVLLKPCGPWGPADLRAALDQVSVSGPRSIGRALEDAAADLDEIRGNQTVVIITTGDENCGGAPCQVAAALRQSLRPLRVFVIMLRPPPRGLPGEEEPPPVWQPQLECIAERGDGALYRASSAGELERILLQIATGIQPNLTVNALHAEGRKVTGVNVERREAWGAALSPSGQGGEGELETFSFPATYSLPAGRYDLSVWYQGQERTLGGVRISEADKVEVEVNFRAGELYVQAKDTAGEELVGDTGGFNCFWGVELFRGGDLNRDYGSACTFPAYFVLSPGSYTIRSWKGESEVWLEEVKVIEGETTVRAAVFPAEEAPEGEGALP